MVSPPLLLISTVLLISRSCFLVKAGPEASPELTSEFDIQQINHDARAF